ncbi:hypothetical protein BDV06DRAFT_224333 [Aspergillus oleicola]
MEMGVDCPIFTGSITETFTKDFQVDPTTRNATSFKQTVIEAARSSGFSRAQAFLETVGAPSSAKAYGTHEELAADNNIDIIYIATSGYA